MFFQVRAKSQKPLKVFVASAQEDFVSAGWPRRRSS